MEIRQKLSEDMKNAMRAKETVKLETIRFLNSAIKNKEIEMRPEPITEKEIMDVIKKLVKQRKESIEQFTAAGRTDLADKESSELKILEEYLPAQLSKEKVEALVLETIKELNATSVKDMGTVMKSVIAKTAGSADNKLVSEIIKAKLNPS
jgi:uncharacterized protein YqeY